MTRSLTGISADQGHSYGTIENAAVRFRQMIEIDPTEELDARKIFNELLGEIELPNRGQTIRIVEAVEECSQEGLTRWDASAERLEVVLSQDTYRLLQENHVRARSTVSHEVGHAVLHTAQIIRLAGLSLTSQVAFHRERNPHEAYMDTEWQANAFGSALLMPAKGLLLLEKKFGTISASDVASHFNVSEESASYRLQNYRRVLGI